MTTVTLSAVGSFFGPVGTFIGGTVGAIIDSFLFKPDPIVQEGPRLKDTTAQAHSPGVVIPIVYGRTRVPGTIIWTSGLKETRHETKVSGGKVGEPEVSQVTYTYAVDLAVLFCEGPIASINNIWAGPKLTYDGTTSRHAADIRIALGTTTQTADSMLEAAEGTGNVPGFRGLVVVYFEDFQLADFGNTIPPLSAEVQRSTNGDDLQFVVGDLCSRAGLTASQYDVLNLPKEQVTGFILARVTTPRAAIQALQQAYRMDAADTGYQLVFRRRNRFADVLVDVDDLAAHVLDEDVPPTEEATREQDKKLPAEVIFQHLDPDRAFSINIQIAKRIITDSTGKTNVDASLTLNGNRARTASEDLLAEIWLQKFTERIQLPPKYMEVDAGDILYIERSDGDINKYRVLGVEIGGNYILTLTIVPHVYIWDRELTATDSGDFVAQTLPVLSNTTGHFIDTSLLTDLEDDRNGFYFAAEDSENGNTWDGGLLFRSLDGTNYTVIHRYDFPVTVGTVDAVLPDGPTDYWDRKNTLTVTLNSSAMSLSSITDAQFRNRENAALVGDEIVTFRDAALVSGTTYDLTMLSRGRRGTDWATDSHGDTANGVNFDGTNDYLTRGADLTGNADGKKFSGSVWLRRGAIGSQQWVARGTGRWALWWASDDTFHIGGWDSSDVLGFEIRTSVITDTTNWHHFVFSVDMTDTNKRHMYVDDVSDMTVLTWSERVIDFTQVDHSVGATPAGADKYTGDMSQLWVAHNQYIDLSVQANRRKFIASNGGVVDLGTDGSTPTGTAPLMFFSGATAGWETNLGTGGGFTENGALTDAATDPTDGYESETFILLETPQVDRVVQELSYMNNTITYKPVTFDQAITDVSAVTFKNTGRWAKPWTVARVSGTRNTPATNDWTISWLRRNRQFNAWRDFADVPMTEETESYEIDIIDTTVKPVTVARTLTSTTTSVVYTEAQQNADFGSPQSSITVRIYQMSAIIGRGFEKEVILS